MSCNYMVETGSGLLIRWGLWDNVRESNRMWREKIMNVGRQWKTELDESSALRRERGIPWLERRNHKTSK